MGVESTCILPSVELHTFPPHHSLSEAFHVGNSTAALHSTKMELVKYVSGVPLCAYVRAYPVELSTVPPSACVEFHRIYNVHIYSYVRTCLIYTHTNGHLRQSTSRASQYTALMGSRPRLSLYARQRIRHLTNDGTSAAKIVDTSAGRH